MIEHCCCCCAFRTHTDVIAKIQLITLQAAPAVRTELYHFPIVTGIRFRSRARSRTVYHEWPCAIRRYSLIGLHIKLPVLCQFNRAYAPKVQ